MRRHRAGMAGGARGTSGEAHVTSGGRDGMNGGLATWSPRTVRWVAFAVFVSVTAAQAVANAYSRHADLAGTDHPVPLWQTGIEEASSAIAWTACLVVIWQLVARVSPSRLGWPSTLALHALATVPVSLLHVGLMVALRYPAFAIAGGDYDFAGDLPGVLLYEYRKDVLSYALLAVFSGLVQWFAQDRIGAESSPPERESFLSVSDGASTHLVPFGEINWIEASGNYVTLHTARREILHRATLASLAQELAPAGFVRIHRSRLVRLSAVRHVETAQSGDFSVTLVDGSVMRGSRRYREGVV